MKSAMNQLKQMHKSKVNGKKGGLDNKGAEGPEASGIQKSLADVVKSMQEATKVFKTQTEAAAKKTDEAKKSTDDKKTTTTSTDSGKKGGDADQKGKEFSYTTKTGKTAHIFNVNQKGSVVEFDAAFDGEKK